MKPTKWVWKAGDLLTVRKNGMIWVFARPVFPRVLTDKITCFGTLGRGDWDDETEPYDVMTDLGESTPNWNRVLCKFGPAWIHHGDIRYIQRL